jgi:hypothetical protein
LIMSNLKRETSPLDERQRQLAIENNVCADGGRCGLGGHCEHCPNVTHELPEPVIEGDLTWLARSVPEWLDGYCHVSKVVNHTGAVAVWYDADERMLDKTAYNKQQWLDERARLQNKPSWDSHKWPNVFQDQSGDWFGVRDDWDLIAHISAEWKGDQVNLLRKDGQYLCSGRVLGDWRKTLEKRPDPQSNTSQTNSLVGEIYWTSMPDGCVAFVEDTVDPDYSDWVRDDGNYWDSYTNGVSWNKDIEDDGYIIVHRPPEDLNHIFHAGNMVNQSEQPLAMVGNKFDSGKPRMDLIPPHAEKMLAEVLTFGAAKYGPENWRMVPDLRSRYIAAAMRHINAWRIGEENDQETGLPHLAHAMCNLAFIVEVEYIDGYTKAEEHV